MKYRFMLLSFIALLSPLLAYNQISIGIKAGPNFNYYIQTKADYINETRPAFGTDAGLVLNIGNDHVVSFRSDLLYSLQVSNTDLFFDQGGFEIYGKFFRHNLLLSLQIQFNMLKNHLLFFDLGPFGQYMVASSGKGSYETGYQSFEFKGNDEINSKKIFRPVNGGATAALGFQNIRLGKVSLFGELRETVGFANVYDDDYSKAEWVQCTTTVAVGVDFIIRKGNKR